MNRTTTARLIGLGVAVAAITIAGAPAAFATDITNPANHPYPVTVVVDGQTYVDGNDTLPGFDDYACTQIPGVNYDFADNQIDYPDGQVAPWTEWSRIPGYAVWVQQQAKASASPKPTTSTAPSSSPSPSATSSGGSSTSTTTKTTTSKPAPSKSATSTTKSSTSKSSSHTETVSKPSTVSTKPRTSSTSDGANSSNSSSDAVEPSTAPTTESTPKAPGTTKTHHSTKPTKPSPAPSDSQSPAAVVVAGSDPTDPPQADGAVAPIAAVNQRSATGTGDTSLAGFGILAALLVAGLGVLGAGQLRRLGGRRLAKGAR